MFEERSFPESFTEIGSGPGVVSEYSIALGGGVGAREKSRADSEGLDFFDGLGVGLSVCMG